MLRALKWFAIIALSLVLLIGAALIGGRYWLASDSGRDFIAGQAEAAGVRIAGLDGDPFGALTAARVEVQDPDGAWLTIENAKFRWRPWALATRTVLIENLSADQVTVARQPASEQTPPDAAPSEPYEPPNISVELQRIAINEIVIAEAVAGTPARLNLTGNARYVSGAAEADLAVDRLDGPGSLTLIGGYRLADNHFDIDLMVNDSAGGLASNLLDLPDGVQATLIGAGDLSSWRGRLDGRTGAAQLADLAITLNRNGDAIQTTVKGDLHPAVLLPADLLETVGDTLAVDLAAGVTETGTIVVERFTAKAAPAAIALEGRFEPDTGAVKAILRTAAIDVSKITPFAPGLELENPAMTAEVSGTVEKPIVVATISANRAAMNAVAAQDIWLKLQATPDLAATELGAPWTARIELKEITLDDPQLTKLSRRRWVIDASGRYDANATKLPIKAAITGAGLAEARFDGAADLNGALEGAFAANVLNFAELAPLSGLPLNGQGKLAGDVRFGPDGLRLRGLNATALGAALSGAVTIGPGLQDLDGAIKLSAPDLGRIARIVNAPIDGAASGDIQLSGKLTNPGVTADLRFRPLAAAGQQFQAAQVKATVKGLATGPNGRLDISAASAYGPLEAGTRFAMKGQTLSLNDLAAKAPGAEVGGDLAVNLNTTIAEGTLRVNVANLADAGRAFGQDASGQGGGVIKLYGGAGGQQVDADLDLKNIAAAGISAKQVTVKASGGVDGASAIKAELAVTEAKLDGADFTEATATLNGPLTGADVTVAFKGKTAGYQASADIAGKLALANGETRFQLASGKGGFAGAPFRLEPGLLVVQGPSGLTVQGLDLTSKPIQVAGSADLAGSRIGLDIKQANADLQALRAFIPGLPVLGQIAASGKISGTLSAPEGAIVLKASDLRAADDPSGAAMQIDGRFGLIPSALSIDLTGASLGPTPLTIKGEIGLSQNATGQNASGPPLPNDASRLALAVAWQGSVEPILALAPLDDHRVTGDAAVDVRIGGTMGAPDVQGQITLGPGGYEHLEFGTSLNFEQIAVTANGPRIALQQFTAEAGPGSITAEAQATLDAAAGYPFKFVANLKNARLVARDDIAATASGSLEAEGGAQAINVVARITTDKVEIELIDNLPVDIPELHVTEIGEMPEGRDIGEDNGAAGGPVINLDVAVNIPGQAFVRGRGLESEWGGDVTIGGTAAQPDINGLITMRRGTFDLLGKRLDISKGEVRLSPDASGKVDALLDIVAEYEGNDFVAKVQLLGPAAKPELILSSTPELPRDEILSRLLFNKNAGALTATESLQLAAAVASLASGGGGFDPVAEVRKAVGIDTLRVDVGEDGAPAVEVGKYITKDIYVGVRQGGGKAAGAVVVEVELFDNVTVESESKQDGSQKVGARLKWDY
jgi:translocation and assembly module TamB